MKNELNKKEKLFCIYYSKTRNTREAAFRAGYTLLPERTAGKLLSKKEVIREIENLDKQRKANTVDIAAGFGRAAFGSIADALRLLYDENLSPCELESLDLFNIAEIKRPKGGGMEIKFFDRLKALDKLQALCFSSCENTLQPFYDALEKSAKKIEK